MPAGDYDDAPRVRSWTTPKVAKGGASAIEGRRVHAVEVIPAGEVIAVKGGDIVDGSAVAGLPGAIRDSAFRSRRTAFWRRSPPASTTA